MSHPRRPSSSTSSSLARCGSVQRRSTRAIGARLNLSTVGSGPSDKSWSADIVDASRAVATLRVRCRSWGRGCAGASAGSMRDVVATSRAAEGLSGSSRIPLEGPRHRLPPRPGRHPHTRRYRAIFDARYRRCGDGSAVGERVQSVADRASATDAEFPEASGEYGLRYGGMIVERGDAVVIDAFLGARWNAGGDAADGGRHRRDHDVVQDCDDLITTRRAPGGASVKRLGTGVVIRSSRRFVERLAAAPGRPDSWALAGRRLRTAA